MVMNQAFFPTTNTMKYWIKYLNFKIYLSESQKKNGKSQKPHQGRGHPNVGD